MDDIARPPVRLQAASSLPISSKQALSRVNKFLDDFQARSTPSKGSDTSITAQLQKLSKAIEQECIRQSK
ncbi:hypothetical protein DEU56DRAFT_795229 [Suillus clintonianus]|uniref:uncharacterized protein n=1 Tax=Suillus clintonianus TaxID=1904413 RepID=UPI001B86996D|nr:uncharacterized protein DEU56DRAFT_795229 [Suillus clintonianus]KAG2141862.1 hypothetical protein DEU56DRAFT_795229 [Suillus clintonianus]